MAYIPVSNQSVSGTVQADVRNSVATVIIGGSIAASFTPPANQSVSGTVNIGNLSTNQSISGTVGSSIIGTVPVVQSGTTISSISGNVTVVSSIGGGIFPISGSVAATVTNFPTTQNISGSVVAWLQSTNASVITVGGANGNSSVQVLNFPTNQSVSGTVATTQSGTWISSIVNIVPSSVIVGASAFGIFPVNGTVTANQGTGFGSVAAHIKSGSVVAVLGGNTSVQAVITSIATANGALPIFAQLPNRVQGVADLRVVQGASVAAIAAQGAGVRTYIDHVQVANYGSTSVLVLIADNTTSTLGWTIAPAGGGSNYDCFYRPAANSPITASINGTASVLVSLQGFTASI